MIINPYLVQPSAPATPLTTAWITATGETDATIISALTTLESDMATYGLTSKMKALYPMVGGTAAKHKFNFMDAQDTDAAFRLNFVGGWTHSSTGATPNGTNAYADTNFTPSGNATLDSHHISYYSRTNSNGTEVELGSRSAGDAGSIIEIRTSNTTYFRVNSASNYITYSDSDSRAFYISNRTGASTVNGWRNGTKVVSGTVGSSTLSTNKYYLAAWNDGGAVYYSIKQTAFASIGDGLTDTEAANFYTAVQAFQTTMARQV
jgi:hypothetical protein